MANNPPSYAKDIQPLFTDMDRQHMIAAGHFDLWKYEDVRTRAQGIYRAVQSGAMPPAKSEPSAPWTPDKVSLFKAWMDGGYAP